MIDYSPQYKNFCEQFDAKVTSSNMQFRARKQIDPYTYTTAMSTLHPNFDIVDVTAIAFHVPEPRIKDMMTVFNEQSLRDAEIRSKYPPVQKAWEKYLTMLSLCGGNDARYRY
jgi:hypothetical protein